MDSTTIKVGRQHKRRFDRLQASFTLLSGRKITQAELLEMLMSMAENAEKPLTEIERKPLKGKELERFMAIPMDLGLNASGRVDEILYGKKKRRRR